MTKFSRCAWPILLTLWTLPSAAFAQPFACYPVQRGDTASRLAARMTGDASNKYQLWFDIVDLSGRSVPKSQYDRVRPGWRVCVSERTLERRPLRAGNVVATGAVSPAVVSEASPIVSSEAASQPASSEAPSQAADSGEAVRQVESPASPLSAGDARPIQDVFDTRAIQDLFRPGLVAFRSSLNVDPEQAWLGAAAAVPALGLLILGGYVRRQNSARIFMSQFAALFVREFERPLLQYGPEPAMRTELRVSRYRARLEILLAPGSGRRYPNLSDHRKNLEYDVERVLSALADESFVCGRLRMRQGWVVVPFRFSARVKQRAVRCISSL
jgi:hypothetical protein